MTTVLFFAETFLLFLTFALVFFSLCFIGPIDIFRKAFRDTGASGR